MSVHCHTLGTKQGIRYQRLWSIQSTSHVNGTDTPLDSFVHEYLKTIGERWYDTEAENFTHNSHANSEDLNDSLASEACIPSKRMWQHSKKNICNTFII